MRACTFSTKIFICICSFSHCSQMMFGSRVSARKMANSLEIQIKTVIFLSWTIWDDLNAWRFQYMCIRLLSAIQQSIKISPTFLCIFRDCTHKYLHRYFSKHKLIANQSILMHFYCPFLMSFRTNGQFDCWYNKMLTLLPRSL